MPDTPRVLPALTRAPALGGRLSVLALVGLAAGAVPLPFVPGAVLRRVRGALVHDIAGLYGLTLTEEARREMSAPSRSARNGAFLATAAFFARRTLRRFGILGILPPLTAWLEVYSLGLLFNRYLERGRSSRTLRIHGQEAKVIRAAIDSALSRAMSFKLEAKPRSPTAEPAEELRDYSTRLLDGVLLAAAALPDYLRRRLETAFDAVLDDEPVQV